MSNSIELELEALNAASLAHLTPSYLFNYFKEELNDKLLVNLVNDLDNLIQTIDTNNSFKILSLNDNDRQQESTADQCGLASQNSSLSSSLSETTITSCKFLLGFCLLLFLCLFREYFKPNIPKWSIY